MQNVSNDSTRCRVLLARLLFTTIVLSQSNDCDEIRLAASGQLHVRRGATYMVEVLGVRGAGNDGKYAVQHTYLYARQVGARPGLADTVDSSR